MFQHRQKRIGKSTYTIKECTDGFCIEENTGAKTICRKCTGNVNEVFEQLKDIDNEMLFSDDSGHAAMRI